MTRLLVVEDQKKLLQSLRRGLEEEGYDVRVAASGEQGFYAATTEEIDLVVLDLALPGRDGLTVLRDLRAHGFAKPVLILTARDTVEDRVRGLDVGADDSLVKPFAFAELLARLREAVGSPALTAFVSFTIGGLSSAFSVVTALVPSPNTIAATVIAAATLGQSVASLAIGHHGRLEVLRARPKCGAVRATSWFSPASPRSRASGRRTSMVG
jgi:CheY-like chemotaxis protein